MSVLIYLHFSLLHRPRAYEKIVNQNKAVNRQISCQEKLWRNPSHYTTPQTGSVTECFVTCRYHSTLAFTNLLQLKLLHMNNSGKVLKNTCIISFISFKMKVVKKKVICLYGQTFRDLCLSRSISKGQLLEGCSLF